MFYPSCTGQRGLFTTSSGLQVVYLSGRPDREHYSSGGSEGKMVRTVSSTCTSYSPCMVKKYVQLYIYTNVHVLVRCLHVRIHVPHNCY